MIRTKEIPDQWKWKNLEDVVDILDNKRVPIEEDERKKRINGKNISELIPYYGATGQVGWIDDYIFNEELVLLGEDGAPFFDISKNKTYTITGKSWVNNHAHVLRAKSGLALNSFISYYLNTFNYHGYVSGATRAKLNQSKMRKIPIPIPSIETQQKIVDILKKAEKLKELRKESDRLTEGYLNSIFIKMFGDPVKNPMSWKIDELGNLLDSPIQNGLYVPKEFYVKNDGTEMVHMSDAFYGIVKRGNLKRVKIDTKDIKKYSLSNDDILIARRSLTYEGSAQPCRIPYSPEPLIFESSLIKVTTDKNKLLPLYLYYYLSNKKVRQCLVLKHVTTSTISGINQTGLKKIPILIPSIKLQKKFTQIAEKVEGMKQSQKQAYEELDNLFNTFMQKAFRGESC